MTVLEPTRPPAPEVARTYRERGYWEDRPLAAFLPETAARLGERTAVFSDRRNLTFAEVAAEADRVAAALHARGIGRGDVVSFQLPNWWEAVVLYQGIARAGAVANPIVPIYRSHELRHILAQAGTRLAVVPGRYRGTDYPALYCDLRADLPDLADAVVVDGEGGDLTWSEFLDGAGTAPDVRADPDHVALLLYTSGTTSAPKGALHSANTLVYENHSLIEWFSLTDRDVIFNPSPVTHVTGVNCALTLPFVLGCPVVLLDEWDPATAWQLIHRHRATFMIFSTPFLAGLLDHPEAPAPGDSPVRWVVCGGADMPPGLLERASDRIGPAVRMYGATECPSATCTTLADPLRARTGTDGRWMTPTEGVLLDSGEIAWSGPDMFLGYLDPALNADAFTPDGRFRTGDLGTMDDDGYLTITGRVKDIVNRAGEKFSAKEIEQLLACHPAVRDVAVVAVPDPVTVEKACAVVVAEPGVTPTLADLDTYLTGRGLSRRKSPEQLVLVDALPRTASGKVQKHVLREQLTGEGRSSR